MDIFIKISAIFCMVMTVIWTLLSLHICVKYHSRRTKVEEDLSLFLMIIAAINGGGAYVLWHNAFWVPVVILLVVLIYWGQMLHKLDLQAKEEDADIRAGLRAFNMHNHHEKLYKRCVYWLVAEFIPITLGTVIVMYYL